MATRAASGVRRRPHSGRAAQRQVYVDGDYAGIVDDYDGVFQRLDLEAGIARDRNPQPGGRPMNYDVNVKPGQTVTIHARATDRVIERLVIG